MRHRHAFVIVVGLLVAAPLLGAADRLLPPASSDLAAGELAAPSSAIRMAPDRVAEGPVSFDRGLEPGMELDPGPRPSLSTSKEYWVDAGGPELRRGLELFTTAPGALVRISPALTADGGGPGKSRSRPVDPSRLEIVGSRGGVFDAEEGTDLLVPAEKLRAAGAPFAEGTAAFRLAPEVGSGRIVLRTKGPVTPSDRYVVHVFDRGSPVEIAVRTARSAYLQGDTVAVEVGFLGAPGIRARRVDGVVSSPSGENRDVRWRRGPDGSFRGELELPSAFGGEGLWEIRTEAVGRFEGKTVVRSVRSAFGVAAPTASFRGDVDVERLREENGRLRSLRVTLGVATAVAGRYEARGVLYGTDDEGLPVPVAVAHAADRLGEGGGELTLEFRAGSLSREGVGSPWELRYLRLMDQDRLGVLHRQARALVLSD